MYVGNEFLQKVGLGAEITPKAEFYDLLLVSDLACFSGARKSK